MFRKKAALTIFSLLILTLLVVSACSSVTANSAPAKQVSIQPRIEGDTVSIPLSDVDTNINTRFTLQTPTANVSFMAYKYDDQVQVRADICPPCRSESFTLKNGNLVCDTCGTVFEAKTGKGVKGACVRFSKQAVAYEIQDGNIVMQGADLVTAYENTLRPQ